MTEIREQGSEIHPMALGICERECVYVPAREHMRRAQAAPGAVDATTLAESSLLTHLMLRTEENMVDNTADQTPPTQGESSTSALGNTGVWHCLPPSGTNSSRTNSSPLSARQTKEKKQGFSLIIKTLSS